MKSKKNIKSILVMAVISIVSLFFINMSFAANSAKVTVETANLREEATSDSRILKLLSWNDEVEVLEKSGEWYKVKVGTVTGYLRKDLISVNGKVEEKVSEKEKEVSKEPEEKETSTVPVEEPKQEQPKQEEPVKQDENKIAEADKKVVKENTKLKIVPVINATDIIEVKKDEEVKVIETINGWACIITEQAKGWIRLDGLKDKEVKPVEVPQEQPKEQPKEEAKPKTIKYVKSATINVRKEANKSSEIVANLSLNTSVEVISEQDGWAKVKFNGKEGYIASSLLANKKQETSRSQTKPRTKNETKKTETKKQETKSVPASGKGSTVVETAKKYVGSKYVYGGSSPAGFDCSGFTSYVFKLHGVNLNRTAAGQYSNGVAVSKSQLQPGDLVMFGSSAKGINHVGLYIGGGQMVHASTPKTGVRIDSINGSYYAKRYVGARRVI